MCGGIKEKTGWVPNTHACTFSYFGLGPSSVFPPSLLFFHTLYLYHKDSDEVRDGISMKCVFICLFVFECVFECVCVCVCVCVSIYNTRTVMQRGAAY